MTVRGGRVSSAVGMIVVLVVRTLMIVVGMTVVLMMMTGIGHRVLAEELPVLYSREIRAGSHVRAASPGETVNRAAYGHKMSVLTQPGQTG
jgi:hypothetical protein